MKAFSEEDHRSAMIDAIHAPERKAMIHPADRTHLTTVDLIAALENTGYSDNKFEWSKFSHLNDKGDAVYLTVWENDEGGLEASYLYVNDDPKAQYKYLAEF